MGLRHGAHTATKKHVTGGPPPPPPGRPYFTTADWLWNPIPASPVLHGSSATWAAQLGSSSEQRNAALVEMGVTLIPASEISAATPRYNIAFQEPWGPDPHDNLTMPIPDGTAMSGGSDNHLAVLDDTTGISFSLWQALKVGSTWQASWGGYSPISGDGRGENATAGHLARYAGVVGIAELQAAAAANTGLSHALFFSSSIAGSGFVYPCDHSDGNGSTNPPQGTRVQLNPSVNIDGISGISAGEKVIGKTMQTHGAYLGDSGGSRMGFIFEYKTTGLASYQALGLQWDYYDMNKIPWTNLRVLKNWNGLA